jgi:hypothetical protein
VPGHFIKGANRRGRLSLKTFHVHLCPGLWNPASFGGAGRQACNVGFRADGQQLQTSPPNASQLKPVDQHQVLAILIELGKDDNLFICRDIEAEPRPLLQFEEISVAAISEPIEP